MIQWLATNCVQLATASDADGWIWSFIVVMGILIPVSIFVYHRCEKRSRLIVDTPTSKVKGVFIGLIELKGNIVLTDHLISFLTDTPCCWYKYKIEEHYIRQRTTTDSEGNTKTETYSGWETVDSGGSRVPFELRDDTARIRIDPAKAQMDGDESLNISASRRHDIYYEKGPSGSISGSTGDRRFSESILAQNEDVYILGSARIRKEVAEYEVAFDEHDEIYMISTRKEDEILTRYTQGKFISVILGLICSIVLPFIVEQRVAIYPTAPVTAILAGIGFTFLITVIYVSLVFNGLVRIRERLVQAWSLIEIQLQRRYDLIPQLVDSLKNYIQHENEIQTSIAAARAIRSPRGVLPPVSDVKRQVATANAQTQALTQLLVVKEAYPELNASDQISELMTELRDTEDRIALAREFYNGSCGNYNARTKRFPEVFFARVFGYKTASFYEIHEFHKTVPVVKLH